MSEAPADTTTEREASEAQEAPAVTTAAAAESSQAIPDGDVPLDGDAEAATATAAVQAEDMAMKVTSEAAAVDGENQEQENTGEGSVGAGTKRKRPDGPGKNEQSQSSLDSDGDNVEGETAQDHEEQERKRPASDQVPESSSSVEGATTAEGAPEASTEAAPAAPRTSVFASYLNKESPFAAAGNGASPFATANTDDSALKSSDSAVPKPSPFASANTGASPFAAFTGSTSAFGQVTGESVFGKAQEDAEEKADEEVAANNDEGNDPSNHVLFSGAGNEDDAEPVEVFTGEENEECLFKTRAKLYRLSMVDAKREYKEQGSGTVRVNVPKELSAPAEGEQAPEVIKPRIVMRREGVYKLLLNATLWDGMPIEKASDVILRFTCVSATDDSSADASPDTFLLRFSRGEQCTELLNAIKKAGSLNKVGTKEEDTGTLAPSS